MGTWAGYVRVSRVGEREETLISPKLQERQIRSWATGAGHELVMLPAELDASGGDDSRPILLGAIEQVERGELDGIVVAKLDRLSRSLAGSVEMLRRIEDAGGQVRSASEQLDASTVSGRTTRNILFSIAQWEREQKAEGFERAKADAIGRGVYIAGRTPLGYRKNAERILEPGDDADAVREAFRLRAKGTSWRVIAERLSERLGLSRQGKPAAPVSLDWSLDHLEGEIRVPGVEDFRNGIGLCHDLVKVGGGATADAAGLVPLSGERPAGDRLRARALHRLALERGAALAPSGSAEWP